MADSYSYDAYGVMLSDNSRPEAQAQTRLLYSGEPFDSSLDQYYLRARYYNQSNGTFNRVDPYSGNLQDPQSLHKYLYCHANLVNGIDPSGMFIGAAVSAVIGFVMAHWVVSTIVVVAVVTAFTLDYIMAGGDYRAGLQHPAITDADIVASIHGCREAAKFLSDIIEPMEKCPVTFGDLNQRLVERNVLQVGEALVGVVDRGFELSAGRQQIINYFESGWWNLFNPEARRHGSWMIGGIHPYLPSKAEVERMDIIVNELIQEARDRGILGF